MFLCVCHVSTIRYVDKTHYAENARTEDEHQGRWNIHMRLCVVYALFEIMFCAERALVRQAHTGNMIPTPHRFGGIVHRRNQWRAILFTQQFDAHIRTNGESVRFAQITHAKNHAHSWHDSTQTQIPQTQQQQQKQRFVALRHMYVRPDDNKTHTTPRSYHPRQPHRRPMLTHRSILHVNMRWLRTVTPF